MMRGTNRSSERPDLAEGTSPALDNSVHTPVSGLSANISPNAPVLQGLNETRL
jgi:hypothetical protein